MIRAKQGFLLRPLGKEYMIVAVGKASEQFNGMIRTNETGAYYWKKIVKGTTISEMITDTVNDYEDICSSEAETVITEFLEAISMAIEYDE